MVISCLAILHTASGSTKSIFKTFLELLPFWGFRPEYPESYNCLTVFSSDKPKHETISWHPNAMIPSLIVCHYEDPNKRAH